MVGEEILNPGTPTADNSYPGGSSGGGGSRMNLEAHEDGVALLVLGPGASSSASPDGPATYPDLTSPTTGSNVPYTDWTTAHGAHLPSQSVVGAYAYPDVVMAMEHPCSAPAPATRTSMPSTGAVISDSYTEMLMAHLSSDMYPATTWNKDVAYPGSVTPSPAINGVAMATAYPGGLNLNAVTAATPDTNAIGFGYNIGLGSERLHPAGTTAAAAPTEPGRGYYYNSGMGLAATSLAMAGLIAGVDTPVTAIALYGMLIAGVILVNVRVFRA